MMVCTPDSRVETLHPTTYGAAHAYAQRCDKRTVSPNHLHTLQMSRDLVGRGSNLAGLAARTTGSFITRRVSRRVRDSHDTSV